MYIELAPFSLVTLLMFPHVLMTVSLFLCQIYERMLTEVYLEVCERGITNVSILKTIGTVRNKKCTLLPFSIMNVIIL